MAEGMGGAAGAKPWIEVRVGGVVGAEASVGALSANPWGQLRTPIMAAIEAAVTSSILRAWGTPHLAAVSTAEGAAASASNRVWGQLHAAGTSAAEGAAGRAFSRTVVITSAEGATTAAILRAWGTPHAAAITTAEGATGSAMSRTVAVSTEEGLAGSRATRPWGLVCTPIVSEAEGASTDRSTARPLGQLRSTVTADPDVLVSLLLARTIVVSAAEGSSGIQTVPPLTRYYLDARGLYRIFNPAEYRFYRSRLGAPSEGLTPFATSPSLPAVPTDTFADGSWYLSMSYFNGVLDSGFLPLGPAGETYVRLDVAAGGVVGSPPAAPLNCRLAAIGGGVVQITAVYYEDGGNRAGEWAIAYTIDGSDPSVDDPDFTAELSASGLAILTYQLPAAADGATVKVRLQTRRNDGTEGEPNWVYSGGSTVQSFLVDASSPSAPLVADRWAGPLPVEEG
jgi:hypothetical protein